MARGKAHSDETRAEVIAALLAGIGVNEVARRYSLDKSVVSRIKSNLMQPVLQEVATEKRERIDDLILENVCANLKAMRAIVDHAGKPAFLEKQSANDLAALYREVSRTTLEILDAASDAGLGEPDEEDAEATN